MKKHIRIAVPNECEQYAQDVKRFVDAMMYKLRVNSHKGRWELVDVNIALTGLKKEVNELQEAATMGNMVEVLLECADVANYAMILASIMIEREVRDVE